jgi:hypothetical protein
MKILKTLLFVGGTSLVAGCGDDGGNKNTVAMKGQRVQLTDSQMKVVKANIAAGTTGMKSVSKSTQTARVAEGQVLELTFIPQSLAMTTTTPKSKSFNTTDSCSLGGSQTISGSLEVTGDQDQGEISLAVEAKADQCQESEGIITGGVKVEFAAKGNKNSGEVTGNISGKTTVLLTENGKQESHSLEFKSFSTKIAIDKELINAMKDSKSDADNQKVADLVSQKTECGGSIAIDTQEIACADLIQTGLEEIKKSKSTQSAKY